LKGLRPNYIQIHVVEAMKCVRTLLVYDSNSNVDLLLWNTFNWHTAFTGARVHNDTINGDDVIMRTWLEVCYSFADEWLF